MSDLGSPYRLPKKAILAGLCLLVFMVLPFFSGVMGSPTAPTTTPFSPTSLSPSATVLVAPATQAWQISTADVYGLATATMASRYAEATATTEQRILHHTATRQSQLQATATMQSLAATYTAQH